MLRLNYCSQEPRRRWHTFGPDRTEHRGGLVTQPCVSSSSPRCGSSPRRCRWHRLPLDYIGRWCSPARRLCDTTRQFPRAFCPDRNCNLDGRRVVRSPCDAIYSLRFHPDPHRRRWHTYGPDGTAQRGGLVQRPCETISQLQHYPVFHEVRWHNYTRDDIGQWRGPSRQPCDTIFLLLLYPVGRQCQIQTCPQGQTGRRCGLARLLCDTISLLQHCPATHRHRVSMLGLSETTTLDLRPEPGSIYLPPYSPECLSHPVPPFRSHLAASGPAHNHSSHSWRSDFKTTISYNILLTFSHSITFHNSG